MDGAVDVTYRTHRFSAADFLRMDETGVFDPDVRIELIEGELIDMVPIGSPHAGTVTFLHQRLFLCLADRALVASQVPVIVSDDTLPQPDLAVLRFRADYYRSAHPRPSDILLLIEVSESSLRFDLGKKMPLYGRAGIPELWIVDVEHSAFHVFREPCVGGYGSEAVVIAPRFLGIAAFPGLTVDLAGFFSA